MKLQIIFEVNTIIDWQITIGLKTIVWVVLTRFLSFLMH